MRGDFSRLRFERGKHYTSVLEQQGRVALDSDWNEQRVADEDIRQTEGVDIIGPFGGPENNAGFGISVSGKTIQIGAGRYYVHGILCESPTTVAYGSQPYLINPAIADSDLLAQLSAGTISSIRLFLEVWRRMVTALDDPCLREPALGQADTTTRLQTVWRVVAERTLVLKPVPIPVNLETAAAATRAQVASGSRLERLQVPDIATTIGGIGTPIGTVVTGGIGTPIGTVVTGGIGTPIGTVVTGGISTNPPAIDCCVEMYQQPAVAARGKLSAQTTGGSSDCSCQPTPAAGFRGLENQLYRVEVHQSGTGATATFKWSRENGSVVVGVLHVGGADVVVDSLGPDANLGFQAGQWVELSDDTYQFGPVPNQPGELFQIKSVNTENRTITMTGPVSNIDSNRNARLRRWEQSGTTATLNGVGLALGSWIDLENGIQVQFADGQFQSGDYWLIPARTATGQIEWPPCGGDGAAFQPPHPVEVIRAPLACIHFTNQQFAVEDCRRLFPPLTEVSGSAVSSLHITKISWNNDDVLPFDQVLANGLTVALDQAPAAHVDASTFVFTLEPPVVSPVETVAVSQGLTPIVLRTSNPLDGTITVSGTTLNWNLPFRDAKGAISGIQLEALLVLNAMLLQGMSYSSFARARIKLLGSCIFAGTGSSRVFLDGQAFGSPGVRADGVTPRTDLTFPSGSGNKASDFDSWFFLAPTLTLASLTVQPAAVIFTPTVPAPPPPPVATLTVNYPALSDTVVALSVISPPNVTQAATVPATVTIPKGKASVTFNVGIKNTGIGTAQTFQIVASLKNALGFTGTVSAALTITGFQIIG